MGQTFIENSRVPDKFHIIGESQKKFSNFQNPTLEHCCNLIKKKTLVIKVYLHSVSKIDFYTPPSEIKVMTHLNYGLNVKNI